MTRHQNFLSLLAESLRNRLTEIAKRIPWFASDKKLKAAIFRRSKEDIAEIEKGGAWYFKRDILERLDSYFEQITKLRRVDRPLYMLYVRTGSTIVSGESSSYGKQTKRGVLDVGLNDGWLYGGERPSFGAIHWQTADMDTEDFIKIKFSCFQKLSGKVGHVEPTNRTVYRVLALYFDSNASDKGLFALNFHVGIDECGDMQLLKEYKTVKQRIRAKDKRKGNSFGFSLSRREWSYPGGLADMARDFEGDVQPDEVARMIFAITANMHRQGNIGARVSVSNGRAKACFNIDMLRTPYFFRDRDVSVLVNGRRKKIFHIVRTHRRHIGGGQYVNVKSHFRGERDFDWNGYRVHVTMPGFHHADLSEFEAAAEEADDKGLSDDRISVQQAAKQLESELMR